MVGTPRVGIFGGTFDPPHAGHLAAASTARHVLGLDRVLMVPANVPWQKAGLRPVSAPADRVAMLRLSIEGVAGLEVSLVEIERGGDSYTVDTVEHFAGEGELWVVIGSDLAPQLPTWHRAEDLRRSTAFAVYDRPRSSGRRPPAGWRYELIEVPQLDLSSTAIRDRVRRGLPIDGLVCHGVATYIASRALYR